MPISSTKSHHLKVFDPTICRRVAELMYQKIPENMMVIGCGLAVYALLGFYGTHYNRPFGLIHKLGAQNITGYGDSVCGTALYDQWMFVDDLISSGTTYTRVRNIVGYDPVAIALFDDDSRLHNATYFDVVQDVWIPLINLHPAWQ
jgi:hypothetical protein